VLQQTGVAELDMAADIARSHHEWWNGCGGPDGLTGEGIPLVARIVAIADSFDALTHDRPWRSAFSFEAACREIEALRGTQFDPVVAEAFLVLMRTLQQQQPNLDEYLLRDLPTTALQRARERAGQIQLADTRASLAYIRS
jgi:putative two-component system response regulator